MTTITLHFLFGHFLNVLRLVGHLLRNLQDGADDKPNFKKLFQNLQTGHRRQKNVLIT